MPAEQSSLFKVTNHGDRGKEFEAEIAAMHQVYLTRGIIDVVQNPNSWDFATGQDWYKYKAFFEKGDPKAARTGDGRYLMRVLSDVDFSGKGFVFDTKETKAKHFPLSQIEPHQIHRLRQSAKCGSNAGFFIKFVTPDRMFWAPITFVSMRFEQWQKESYGRRRAKAGTASLSIEDLERSGKEILRDVNRMWDWYKELKSFGGVNG